MSTRGHVLCACEQRAMQALRACQMAFLAVDPAGAEQVA